MNRTIETAVNQTRLWPGRRQAWWPGLLAALALGLAVSRLPLGFVLAVMVGGAVMILTFIQPLFGLALALFAGPLGALENVLLGAGSFDTAQGLLLLTLGAWISRWLLARRFNLPRVALTPVLLLFILIMLLSLLGAPDLVLGFKEVLKWVEITAVMLLVVDLGRGEKGSPSKIGWIVAMLLLAGLSQALIGIWQFGLRGDGPEHFLILDRFYRAAGTFEQPNPFGGYMAMSALLAGGLVLGMLTAWWQNRRSATAGGMTLSHAQLGRFVLVSLVFALTALALLFSWSRGAWMGFAAGLVVLLAFWPRRLALAPLVLLLLLAALLIAFNAGLLPTAVVDRLGGFAGDFTLGDVRGVDINDANYSVLERIAHWQAALDMTRDNLWLGVGFGNYGAAYADYDLINWPDALGHAHNYYLNLLAETGVIGLLAYLLLWGAVVWQTVQLLRRAAWPQRGLVMGLLAVWTAVTIHHLVDKLYVNNIYIHLGVLFGLLELLSLQVDDYPFPDKNVVEGSA
jgi:O-antigen ligase